MKKTYLIIGLLVSLALAVGYILGGRDNSSEQVKTGTSGGQDSQQSTDKADTGAIDGVIDYSLPEGWLEASCSSGSEVVYFQPNDEPVNCESSPDLQISLALSDSDITECSQIQDVQEVSKHICKSRFINDLRSLEAETEYLESSVYGRETFVKTYYIDSGSGIVKAEYIDANGTQFLSGFEELVSSVKAN